MPPLTLDLFDPALAARSSMGQDPIVAIPNSASAVDAVAISWAYGRLGNNVYQMLNAATAAAGLGLPTLLMPRSIVDRGHFAPFAITDLNVAPLEDHEATGLLRGSFFVPFGCEAAVLGVADGLADELARGLCDTLFSEVLAEAEATEPTIAVAFRGGDVFIAGPDVPSTYVQPPAAFYLSAIAYLRTLAPDLTIDLVHDDRANPALSIVEDALAAGGVPFRSPPADARTNLVRLCAGQALVSCPSTFAEAAALISRRIRTLVSFREHASQSEFRPFMQWRFPRVLRLRGVEGVLIDDASRSYTNKWTWAATPAQLDAIRTFDPHNLRLYRGL